MVLRVYYTNQILIYILTTSKLQTSSNCPHNPQEKANIIIAACVIHPYIWNAKSRGQKVGGHWKIKQNRTRFVSSHNGVSWTERHNALIPLLPAFSYLFTIQHNALLRIKLLRRRKAALIRKIIANTVCGYGVHG